jgi:hypothetical protein
MSEAKCIKVAFELERDANGYPPCPWETLWAYEVETPLYCLDNIPFFAMEVSPGDVVRVKDDDGQLVFEEVVRPSKNSVFRVYVEDEEDVQNAREEFRKLGCESELSDLPKLFAFEVPGSVSFDPVATLLTEGDEGGRWKYEEACLRHPLPIA